MIKKFKYMVEGIENPITEIVMFAINWKKGTKLDDFINRANAVWEKVCEWSFTGNKIELEISTKCLEWSRYSKLLPYIQVKCKECFYRIYIDDKADGIWDFQNRFGDFYRKEDISDIAKMWTNGDYTGTIEPKQEREEVMVTQQETDLFVISQEKIWSVDAGECLQENMPETQQSYIFKYKLHDYNNSLLKFEVNLEACEVLVTELMKDECEFYNVEYLQYCLIECIKTNWLRKLEILYRDGRSNLPDAVFDHIMEVRGMKEERLQAICKTDSQNGHYNSYGVQSSKCVPTIDINENYPASREILSQNKVRDVNKLMEIVHNWDGKAVMSWKLDGAAVRLHYKGTSFVRAESKGKARDVSGLIRKVNGFVDVIKHGLPFLEDWFKQEDWFVTGELVAENCRRSTSAGYLLRKDLDSEETNNIARRLYFVVYDSNICEYQSKDKMIAPIRLYSQMMNLLREAGFRTVDLCEFRSGEQITEGRINEDLPVPQEFDTDGLVIRLNDIKKYTSFGETSHHPKGSVAFKFEDEWKRVTPDCIYGKRGSNGVLKLIAEFRPLHFGDKVVKSAVWQPKDNGLFELAYDSSLYQHDGGYEVWCKNYSVPGAKQKLSEYFDVSKIEVCLRGCVIPQWRLIEQ